MSTISTTLLATDLNVIIHVYCTTKDGVLLVDGKPEKR